MLIRLAHLHVHIMKARQCFGLHTWSRWSMPIVTETWDKHQWRVCLDCNKAQFRTLRIGCGAAVNHICEAIREVQSIKL